MFVDMRKLSNGTNLARFIYRHGHFCIRVFHLLIIYPIYSCFLLFIIYLQIMDIILYFKIRSRGSLDSDIIMKNYTNLDLSNHIHIFDSLPIKKIMIGQITHYIRSPLAEFMESKLHFTYYFPLISANIISFFHCFLSLISIKFFSSESLFRRQIGVLIFELRTFLDCLDGVVFRAYRQNQRYKSYYGDFGYYIDVISDILGGTCLVIGCLIYFSKHRPIRQVTIRMIPSNDIENEQNMLSINNIFETKENIIISLSLFALRYSLAAIFWDRNVHAYEDLLDSYTNKSQEQILQLRILHSPLTILIFYLWRYLSAISIQDYLLFAILFNRTWEFIQKTSTIGWISLLITIILTELHIEQIRSLFSVF